MEDGSLNYYRKLSLFPVIRSASGTDTCHLSALRYSLPDSVQNGCACLKTPECTVRPLLLSVVSVILMWAGLGLGLSIKSTVHGNLAEIHFQILATID